MVYNEAVCNGLTSSLKHSKVSVTPTLGGLIELCLISILETTHHSNPGD